MVEFGTFPGKFGARRDLQPSYNFIDVVRGKAIIDFYGGETSPADTVTLSDVKFWSSEIDTRVANGAGSRISRNFDIDWMIPKTIEGYSIISVPLGTKRVTNDSTAWADVYIKKVDAASNVTTLISGATQTVTRTGGDGYTFEMRALQLDIPRTMFKKGETFRLNLEIIGQGGGGQCILGHDPKNRAMDNAASTDPSQLTIQVPVVIDV